MKVLKGKSGITILFKPVPGKLVDIKHFVNCGCMDEHEPQEEGLCHALEHMYFAGTEERTWEDLVREFRMTGAESNAWTDYQFTAYSSLVPKSHWEEALAIQSDMLYNSTFPEERWETVEKNAVTSEILANNDEDYWYLEEMGFRNALGPSYHDPVGSVEAINNASVKDLKNFSDRYYRGRNIFLAISGDLTPAEVLKAVNRVDQWTNKRPKKRVDPVTVYNAQPLHLKKEDMGQSLVMLVKPVKDFHTTKELVGSRIALGVLHDYLYREIRDIRGLCYDITPDFFDSYPDYDYLNIITACEHKHLQTLIKEIVQALERFPRHGLTSGKIEEARMIYTREAMTGENDVSQVTSEMGNLYLQGRKTDPFDLAFHGAKNVSDALIKRVAKENFTGNMKLITMVDSECEKD